MVKVVCMPARLRQSGARLKRDLPGDLAARLS
jgi:hypothetical protein